ncbi:hypothetical protein [Arthrobacter sp. 24S4-2]|uniref:GerMN domain-containing protein n=1 Tax=Arthrobacter sp. 24S4-2 TaxID=2575374 RepID=UPI0020C76FF0|nr:hypothetical protein [Arthrobacter sp. 24S4-2]
MIFTPGIRAAAAGAAIMLPLWLGSCSLPAAPPPEGAAAQAGGVPDPRPLPFPVIPSAEATPTESATSAPAKNLRPGGSVPPQASASSGGSPAQGADTVEGAGSGQLPPGSTASGGAAAGSSGASGAGNLAAPEAAVGGQAALPGELPGGTPVYFVSLDDGGTTGVRFGCNDSLVAVFHSPGAAEEPLRSSFDILLGGGDPPDGLYNALENSDVEYVSAYFDGTTVVVNLTGTLRPGGVCDLPRLEAQLTHTAVSAVGASRAEIYVDGRLLADILSLR